MHSNDSNNTTPANPFSDVENFLRRASAVARRRSAKCSFSFQQLGDFIHIHGVNAFKRPAEFVDYIMKT
jgi:hypothetical protein